MCILRKMGVSLRLSENGIASVGNDEAELVDGFTAMHDPTRIWRVAVSILLIVLVLATAMESCGTTMISAWRQLHAVSHGDRVAGGGYRANESVPATAECTGRRLTLYRNAG